MKRSQVMEQLIDWSQEVGLIKEADRIYSWNRILAILELHQADAEEDQGFELEASIPMPARLLEVLLDDAVRRGVIEDYITERDILDSRLMDALMPRPSDVIETFGRLYQERPEAATDWYYTFSQDSHYIRRDRIQKDIRRVYESDYGPLDITINLSKPEKDPRAIAADRSKVSTSYPLCALCKEAEGYEGHQGYAARSNHRILPLDLGGERYFLQYSPYVYYHEHCIVLNEAHVPMVIDRRAFERLLDFVTVLPHYFIGSNADLPIVGGSILSHDHYQGGHYRFAMENATVLTTRRLASAPHVTVETLKWPLTVLRLRAEQAHRKELLDLAEHMLTSWRHYSDASLGILHQSEGEPHNTITPIARLREGAYELDLVLRNNRRSEEHPLGIFHPHEPWHHIKKENIGLIEVMGLAVLPARLRTELARAAELIVSGGDYHEDALTVSHASWLEAMVAGGDLGETMRYEDCLEALYQAAGKVFMHVLEDAGVYKQTAEGQEGLERFLGSLE